MDHLLVKKWVKVIIYHICDNLIVRGNSSQRNARQPVSTQEVSLGALPWKKYCYFCWTSLVRQVLRSLWQHLESSRAQPYTRFNDSLVISDCSCSTSWTQKSPLRYQEDWYLLFTFLKNIFRSTLLIKILRSDIQ